MYNKLYVRILQQNQQFTCKQTIDQSQFSDGARNWRRIRTVSIFVAQQSCTTCVCDMGLKNTWEETRQG